MKFTVFLKDPDAFWEAVRDACKTSLQVTGLDKQEQELLLENRTEKTLEFLSKWVDYSEEVYLEFDTEAGTAVVMERDQ